MARPTKLDDLTAKRIVDAVRNGNTRECAARLARVNPDTLYEWLRRGEAGDAAYSEFSERLRDADAQAESHCVGVVFGFMSDPKLGLGAATWWLERRRQEAYGPKREPKDTPMTEEEARRVVEEAAKLAKGA